MQAKDVSSTSDPILRACVAAAKQVIKPA
uniref:Uncharacterized protein n=1 Tax=Arundo donax TaxID=35708 RepID=A0A0A9BA73_ARUDO